MPDECACRSDLDAVLHSYDGWHPVRHHAGCQPQESGLGRARRALARSQDYQLQVVKALDHLPDACLPDRVCDWLWVLWHDLLEQQEAKVLLVRVLRKYAAMGDQVQDMEPALGEIPADIPRARRAVQDLELGAVGRQRIFDDADLGLLIELGVVPPAALAEIGRI